MYAAQCAPKALIDNFDGLFLDLDGVCYLGAKLAPNADTALAAAKERGAKAFYITNNSSRTPVVIAEHLTRIGIPTQPETVVNSALAAVAEFKADIPAGAKVLAVGGIGIKEALANAGYEVVTSADDQPVAVLQGLSEDVGWAQLSEAVIAIKAGAQHFATNLDGTLPKERGEMIGNGSLVAAVTNATQLPVRASGKPYPFIYHYAAEISGLTHPLAVGDRLNTDIAGAVAAGIPSLHVLTGVSQAREVVLASAEEQPTFLAFDMEALNQPYPEIEKVGKVWQTQDAAVKINETVVDKMLVLQLVFAGRTLYLTETGAKQVADDVKLAELRTDNNIENAEADVLKMLTGAQDLSIFTLCLDEYRVLAQAVWEYRAKQEAALAQKAALHTTDHNAAFLSTTANYLKILESLPVLQVE